MSNFNPLSINRRSFLTKSFAGLGGLALSDLIASTSPSTALQQQSSEWDGIINSVQHFAPKAKRVIHLCMAGGPSQFDGFDYKPELNKLNGKEFPSSYTEGQQLAQDGVQVVM